MFIEAFGNIQVLLIRAGGIFTALLIVAIYFSTSLAIILSAFLGLFWLLSARFMVLSDTLNKNPVAAWSLLLFLCFIFGLFYSSATFGEAFSMLMKYRELLFIPVLISFLSTEVSRRWVWKSFVIASVLILLISYLMYYGIIDLNGQGDPAFKSRITHSILISFFAFFCAHKACDGNRYAKLYWVLFILCMYNLFFMVEGRTGQLTAALLFLLFAVQRLTKKMLLLTVLGVAVFLAVFFAFSDKATRINEGVVNIQSDLKPDTRPISSDLKSETRQIPSSMGQRYMFWRYSLKLIEEKPILGHGTGSFAKEYQRLASNELFLSKNPHNEFFMISVQLGLLGLLFFLGFLASQYYCAKKLPDKEKWLAQGLLLSLIVTSLFNSPLLDHTEGHWFTSMIALCFASLHTENKTDINHA